MDRNRRATLLRRSGWVVGGTIVVLVIALAILQSLDLRKPIARFASAKSGRSVEINGPLHLRLLTWNPSAAVEQLRVSNTSAPDSGDLFTAKRIDVQLQLLSVFRRNLVLPLLRLDEPSVNLLLDAKGHASWDTGEPPPEKAGTPPKIPTIRQFLLTNGSLKFVDQQHKLSVDAKVSANEGGDGDQHRAFKVTGEGLMNGAHLTLEAGGGPLLDLQPERPYNFDAHVRAAGTRIDIDGSIDHPFDLTQYHARAELEGPDLADLYYLSGFTLPNTPPYKIAGTIMRKGTDWRFDPIAGAVGVSDIGGSVAVDTSGKIPVMTADLHSKRLDLADLAPSLGAPPVAKEQQAASPQQRAVAKSMADNKRLLPDSVLDVTRVREMNGTLKYRAAAVDVAKLPMKAVALDLKLDNGVIRLQPVSFEFPQGHVAVTASIDARQSVPVTTLDLRLSNLKLEQLIPHKTGAAPFGGTLQGRMQLTGAGKSVHQFAAASNGTVTMVVLHGDVREAFAELTGINIAKGLGLLITKDEGPTPLRCGVAAFQAKSGTLTAQQLVFDTTNVLITGGGSIQLDDETLHLNIEGHPKKFRVARLRSPILLKGQLRDPGFALKTSAVAEQAGAATALGVLLTPLAAVLAFVDPGLAKDADCQALLSDAQTKGAPVSDAAIRESTQANPPKPAPKT